jgi:ATP-dependent Clp protease adaptor protein ClpS
MDAVLIALAAAAGAGALWWQKARPTRAQKLLASAFDTDAEVALHVAQHECRTRGQALSSIHILYGLIQDETVVGALRDAGHDPEALETRVLAALDSTTAQDRDPEIDVTERVQLLYARALYSAQTADRKATCVDLWAYLADSDAAALLDAAGVAHVDVLFRLYHRHAPPSLDGHTGDVHVVLRNDDYTTREIVVEILMTTFGYDARLAETRMMETHTQGRGVVGRYPVATARAKVAEVRELTRSRGFPLWIAIEPT